MKIREPRKKKKKLKNSVKNSPEPWKGAIIAAHNLNVALKGFNKL